jgi:transketolase
MNGYDNGNLKTLRSACLNKILKLYKKANAGHIGSSLSCLDILVYLYFQAMDNRDRFILSKGHAALALYVVLARKKIIDPELLETFYQNGTLLSAHPPCNSKLNGIPFGTGSLGHGLSLAAGLALASRFTGSPGRVFCLLSEGDCDEGSTWEAALFASQHHLKNLFVIMDYNGLQGLGKSEGIVNLEPLADKWRSFNFDVAVTENGNEFDSLHHSFTDLEKLNSDKPKCIIARTIKGNGVSFMENIFEWHYLPMTEEQYQQALRETTSQ